MALFLGQSLTTADQLTMSEIEAVYESDTFKAWKDARDHAVKLGPMIIGRIDGLSKQIAGLTKALSRR